MDLCIIFQMSLSQVCYFNVTTHCRSFGKTSPLFGSTEVLLGVMRPSQEEMESNDTKILPYIFSPYYMYDKKEYPQFLSGSGNFVVFLKWLLQMSILEIVFCIILCICCFISFLSVQDTFFRGPIFRACMLRHCYCLISTLKMCL